MSATVRTFPLLSKANVTSTVATTAGSVISIIGSTESAGKIAPSTNGITSLESGLPQLIPRCADTSSLRALENVKKAGKAGTNCQNVSGSPTDPLPEKYVLVSESQVHHRCL